MQKLVQMERCHELKLELWTPELWYPLERCVLNMSLGWSLGTSCRLLGPLTAMTSGLSSLPCTGAQPCQTSNGSNTGCSFHAGQLTGGISLCLLQLQLDMAATTGAGSSRAGVTLWGRCSNCRQNRWSILMIHHQVVCFVGKISLIGMRMLCLVGSGVGGGI